MLHKSKSFLGTIKGAIFIPLASALIFIFACAENGENTISQTDKSSPQETKSESSSSTTDEIFSTVEEMPTFQGKDINAFRNYIYDNLEYPEEAMQQNIEGKVMVQFVVNKEGQVEQVEVTNNADPLLEQEAIRIVENAPQWEPGKQRGQKVNVQFTVPVAFRLNK